MVRRLSPCETAAPIVFHDRYVKFRDGDAAAFWRSLSAADRDLIDHLVRVVADAVAAANGDAAPQCPKRCDVATRPEPIAPGRFVCQGCGTEFAWRPH